MSINYTNCSISLSAFTFYLSAFTFYIIFLLKIKRIGNSKKYYRFYFTH